MVKPRDLAMEARHQHGVCGMEGAACMGGAACISGFY